jgi:lysophospholipase L1-like esterase
MPVATLLLLELVMQIGSVAVWYMQRKPLPEVKVGDQMILCVGDSWTHGMGSTDTATRSYPAVMESMLRERTGQPWVVANCGQAGQNSRDVLQRLSGQLAEFRPKIVCVLIGTNDSWTKPEPLPVDEQSTGVDHRSYRFRWRLPRLVAWIAGRLSGTGEAPAAAATRTGPEWARRQPVQDNPYWQTERANWETTAETQALKSEGWRLTSAKDIPGALRSFSAAIEACPEDAQSRWMLAVLQRQAGHNDAAQQELVWLRAKHAQHDDFWSGTCLAQALHACGQFQESLDVAKKLTDRFPLDGSLWRLRAENEFFLGNSDDAARSIEEAMRCWPDQWNYHLRSKIYLLGKNDVAEALRSALAAYVALNDANLLEQLLLTMGGLKVVERARPLAAALDCPPDVRARIQRVIDDVVRGLTVDTVALVLQGHLGRIITTCRNAGASPVLLTYPVPGHGAEPSLRSAAAEEGVPFVELRQLFDEKRGARTWEDLKALDGHCNDDGYYLMADIVTDALIELFAMPRK